LRLGKHHHPLSGNYGNLLDLDGALELGVLQLVNKTVSTNNPETFIIYEYQSLFRRIGKVKGKVIILPNIGKEVHPKQQPYCSIPFHIRNDIKQELRRLEDLDIIEEVSGPTLWVSPNLDR